jgi:MFS family permease
MDVAAVALVAATVFVWGVVSARLERADLTAPIVFVTIGAVLGGLGLIDAPSAPESLKPLVEVTLVWVLFSIAGVSFLMSLYFQDPATFGMSRLEAGLALLPVAALVILVAPAVTPLANRFGARRVVVLGFLLLTAGFAVLAAVRTSWSYAAFLPALLAIAVGLGLSNGPSSSIATASVGPDQVGAASGISNMARYVGGAVMTAVVAGIYASVTASRTVTGAGSAEALTTGLSRACIVLAIFCALGIPLARRVARRTHPPRPVDLAAAAAATSHTLPIAPPP